MRAIAFVLAVLAVTNGVLWGLRRSSASERARLVEAASRLADEARDAHASIERRRSLDALVERARPHPEDPRDIGTLRDGLIGAEHGLAIDRLSLDFRPEERLPPELGGSRVIATLRGGFDAVYDYLRRIETLHLPLALDDLSVRGDAAGVTLTVGWAARWPRGDGDDAVEISLADVERLNAWLNETPPPRPERDAFAFESERARGAALDTGPSPEPPELRPVGDVEPEGQPERPVLTGFVLARPELEPDVRRRVLAALRYEGETRLVMVGDSVNAYVVSEMEARDSVTLTRADTGEQLRLTLR